MTQGLGTAECYPGQTVHSRRGLLHLAFVAEVFHFLGAERKPKPSRTRYAQDQEPSNGFSWHVPAVRSLNNFLYWPHLDEAIVAGCELVVSMTIAPQCGGIPFLRAEAPPHRARSEHPSMNNGRLLSRYE